MYSQSWLDGYVCSRNATILTISYIQWVFAIEAHKCESPSPALFHYFCK
jgi:hypothetical protein